MASALDVVFFVREIIETNPKLRESILSRLLDTFYQIRATRVLSCALWIIAEYSQSLAEVEQGLGIIKQSLGELPFYVINEDAAETDALPAGVAPGVVAVPAPIQQSKRPAVLADGTYATQSAASEVVTSSPAVISSSLTNNIRGLLITGDFFLGAVLAASLTKLILRYEKLQKDLVSVNQVRLPFCFMPYSLQSVHC